MTVANNIVLRISVETDLETFFMHQLDDEAAYMAAFTAKDRTDKEAYMIKWRALLAANPGRHYTILAGDTIAGSIFSYEMEGEPQVSYWIGREYWGCGVATTALRLFLSVLSKRPLYGRVATDNTASARVLEKNGFVVAGHDKGFANARGGEIEETVYRLD